MKRHIMALVTLLAAALPATAQVERPASIYRSIVYGLEYEINAAYNLGGAAPVPLPAEIRAIDSFNPLLNLSIGTTVTKWFDKKDKSRDKWGIALGLRFETRGMQTKATVKNYGMEIINDGSLMKGRWTGRVQTKYHVQQLTIPVTAVYQINPRWKVNLGPYVAAVLSKTFSGQVSDGYLREGDPTGTKWSFTDGKFATYDFSGDLRTFQWGLQAGGSFRVLKRMVVNANLTWGFNNIFNKDFKTVSFNMYPIYLNMGFGYVF